MSDDSLQPKPATDHTRAAIDSFAATLPLDDGTDAANVARGFIATRSEPIIERHAPNPWQPHSWDLSRSDFVHGPVPKLSLIHI